MHPSSTTGSGIGGLSLNKAFRFVRIEEVSNGFTIHIEGQIYQRSIAKTVDEVIDIVKNALQDQPQN